MYNTDWITQLDLKEVCLFRQFLIDSKIMNTKELVNKYGADYLGFKDKELEKINENLP